MGRGKFVYTLMAGGLIAGSAMANANKPEAKRNILFIAVDDLKPTLGCYGDAKAITPNIDRLAEAGMVFLNSHCQQAVCGPSRASLMTGLRPDRTRVWDLKTKIRKANPDALTLPEYFRSQGFTTAGTGKIYDSRSVDKKVDEPSWSVPYRKEWELPTPSGVVKPVLGAYQSEAARSLAKEAKVAGITGYGPVRKYFVENDAWLAVESEDVPDNFYTDGLIADYGLHLMKKLKSEGRPFFLAVGFKKPHLPFVAPKKYWDLYERDEFEIHPFQQKSKDGVDFAYHDSGELRSYIGAGEFNSYKEGQEMPADKQQMLMHGYYACVSFIDAQVGKLMDELKAQGLADNTAIVLWGDHGWHLGDHGLWCKHSNFEQATRAPLIFSAAGFAQGAQTDAPVEFVDIFPTLCELGGVPVPENLDGQSLVPVLKDASVSIKPFAVSQWPRGQTMGYAIRDTRYRFVEWAKNHKGIEPYSDEQVVGIELYDYSKDPLETVNLAKHPEYQEVVEKMTGQLREFLEKQSEK
ncbi:sulfatase [Verrucomicrobiota bacterium]